MKLSHFSAFIWVCQNTSDGSWLHWYTKFWMNSLWFSHLVDLHIFPYALALCLLFWGTAKLFSKVVHMPQILILFFFTTGASQRWKRNNAEWLSMLEQMVSSYRCFIHVVDNRTGFTPGSHDGALRNFRWRCLEVSWKFSIEGQENSPMWRESVSSRSFLKFHLLFQIKNKQTKNNTTIFPDNTCFNSNM